MMNNEWGGETGKDAVSKKVGNLQHGPAEPSTGRTKWLFTALAGRRRRRRGREGRGRYYALCAVRASWAVLTLVVGYDVAFLGEEGAASAFDGGGAPGGGRERRPPGRADRAAEQWRGGNTPRGRRYSSGGCASR